MAIITAALGQFVRGRAGKFLGEWVLSFGSDQAEDAMSTSLRKMNWARAAEGGPDVVKKVVGMILGVIPDAFLTPRAFSAATAAITASVRASHMSETAKRVVSDVIDAINDELRDLIAEGKFEEARRILEGYANGTHTHSASGAKEGKMANDKAASGTGSEEEKIEPIELDWWQGRAMALFHALLVGASITQDTIAIEKARRTRERYENNVLKARWLLENLPEYPEDWYANGFALLDELQDIWTERAGVAENAPNAKKYFKDADEFTRGLVRRIQREYIDKFRPFIDLVDMVAEKNDSKFGDKVEALGNGLGDMFDGFLTREGRENWRRRRKHLGDLADTHGAPGLGFYGLVAAMLVSETVMLLFSGLAGTLFWLLVGPVDAGKALAIPLILGFAINAGLAAVFHNAVGDHKLGPVAWFMALLISIIAPTLTLIPFSWVPERQVMAIAPLLMACLLSFLFYLWLLPLDGIAEAMRGHTDSEKDGPPGLLQRLFNFAIGNAEANSLAPGGQISRLPIYHREINVWTHFTSLLDIVGASTLWVVASLMLAPGMSTRGGSLALSLIGMIAGIYAAAEMFRRNRLAEYGPRTKHLLETEWNIVFLRRFATQAMFWGVVVTSSAEFLFYLIMMQAGDTVLMWWGSVLGTIGILWVLFAIGGVALMIGAFALLFQGARSETGLGMNHGSTAGLILVAGILIATIGFHSRDSGTLGDAIERRQAQELIDRHSSPRSPWSW